MCRGLQVEAHRSEIGDRRHSSHGTHHLSLNVFQRLSLRFRNIEDYEQQTDAANGSEEPEGTVISDRGYDVSKSFRDHERARPVEGSGN